MNVIRIWGNRYDLQSSLSRQSLMNDIERKQQQRHANDLSALCLVLLGHIPSVTVYRSPSCDRHLEREKRGLFCAYCTIEALQKQIKENDHG